jgi:hypothetical protein
MTKNCTYVFQLKFNEGNIGKQEARKYLSTAASNRIETAKQAGK